MMMENKREIITTILRELLKHWMVHEEFVY